MSAPQDMDDEAETSPTPAAPTQPASKTIKVDTSNLSLEGKPINGNALVQSQTTVRLSLIGTDIVLTVQLADRLMIGRSNFDTSNQAGIDLTSYGGREQGVSHHHAMLYRTRHTLSLVDLSSTNGTYLNGSRIPAHQPQLLHDGDEIWLGKMQLHLHFTDTGSSMVASASSKPPIK